MTEMDEFEKTVSQFKGRQFNIIEPGGDFGDTLIYLGLEKKLSRMKLNFRLFKRSEEYDLLLRILSPVINKHFDRLLNTNFVCARALVASFYEETFSFNGVVAVHYPYIHLAIPLIVPGVVLIIAGAFLYFYTPKETP